MSYCHVCVCCWSMLLKYGEGLVLAGFCIVANIMYSSGPLTYLNYMQRRTNKCISLRWQRALQMGFKGFTWIFYTSYSVDGKVYEHSTLTMVLKHLIHQPKIRTLPTGRTCPKSYICDTQRNVVVSFCYYTQYRARCRIWNELPGMMPWINMPEDIITLAHSQQYDETNT